MVAAAGPAVTEVGLVAELSIAGPANPVIKQEPLDVQVPKKRQGYRKNDYFHITQAEREWLIPVKDTRPHAHTVSHHKNNHQVGRPQVGAVHSTASSSILSPFSRARPELPNLILQADPFLKTLRSPTTLLCRPLQGKNRRHISPLSSWLMSSCPHIARGRLLGNVPRRKLRPVSNHVLVAPHVRGLAPIPAPGPVLALPSM